MTRSHYIKCPDKKSLETEIHGFSGLGDGEVEGTAEGDGRFLSA